jgi:hypothetical protein
MSLTLPCLTRPGVGTGLGAAASLLAAAALLAAAGDARHVSVTVNDTDISMQISRHAGDPATRAAAVAAYAEVLHSGVQHRPSPSPGTADCWVETRGQVGGHQVHVWTLIHGHEQEP